MQETRIQSLGWEDFLEEGMATHSSILALEDPHGQRSLVGCSPGVAKSRERLSDFTFTFHFHALEKAMATLEHGSKSQDIRVLALALPLLAVGF